jgi:hypothetical protein
MKNEKLSKVEGLKVECQKVEGQKVEGLKVEGQKSNVSLSSGIAEK